MRARRAVAGTLFGIVLLGASPAAHGQEPSFDIHFVVMKTATTAGRIEAEQVTTVGGALLACGRFTVEWGGESLKADGRQLFVNGRAFSPGSGSDATGGALAPLSTPSVRTRLGQSAQLKAGLADAAQYFERDADGRFSLKTLPVTPELSLDVTLGKSSAPDSVATTLSYRFIQLGKRVPVAGVSLDVGPPEFRDVSGRTEAQVKLGQWCLVGLGDRALASGLVVLMRTTRAR